MAHALQRRRIWVVDDSRLDAERAKNALSSDLQVEIIGDGAAALERISVGPPPDLMLVDWIMPGVSGLDLCKFIRSGPDPRAGPGVILTTARRTSHEVAEALEAGADDYVAKPWSDVELNARVLAVLRHRQMLRSDVRRLDLYSIVAHDLRTPLSSMLLRTDALLRGARGPLPAPAVGDLERMQHNILALVELINDFLDLARLEGTGFALQTEKIDLAAIVQTTMDDFQPLLRASELTWRDVRPGGPVVVVGDPRRFVQVIANLVANAIKFTPPGGTITTKVAVQDDAVEVCIQDTGRGIAKESIPNLFQRYQRSIDAAHQVAGTGLGLLIVREIIEAHGGVVGVDSTPGVGSTFWFRVPRPLEGR
jgi:signal transduction histidine kinase